jgi:heme oxygenase
MKKMLDHLREETKVLHQEIEKDNLAAGIMTHQISLEEYKLLLLQNYLAYREVEKKIQPYLESWDSSKSTRLKQDLENLKVETEGLTTPSLEINNLAEALGAAYVLEGSALGGMMIAREIANCEALAHLPKQFFFSAEREHMQGWNDFLKRLRTSKFSQDEIEKAGKKARETFQFFHQIFQFTPEISGS